MTISSTNITMSFSAGSADRLGSAFKIGDGLYGYDDPVLDLQCPMLTNSVPKLHSSNNGIYYGRALSSEVRPIWGQYRILKVN
jgi:hypothetical protein